MATKQQEGNEETENIISICKTEVTSCCGDLDQRATSTDVELIKKPGPGYGESPFRVMHASVYVGKDIRLSAQISALAINYSLGSIIPWVNKNNNQVSVIPSKPSVGLHVHGYSAVERVVSLQLYG